MRSGIWQLAVGGGGPVERRNKLSECCRADEKSLSGRKRSDGLAPSLSRSFSLPPRISLSFSLYPLSPIPLSSLSLSVYLSQHPLHLLTLRTRSLFFSLISFRRCFVGRGGENNQRKFDGNTRITSDHEMRSDTFEYRLYARPRQHVEESRSTINQQTRYHDA